MTDLLEKAVAAARSLPPSMQDEIARTMLLFVNAEQEPVALTVEERNAIALSKAAVARGEFATDDDVRVAWASYGL